MQQEGGVEKQQCYVFAGFFPACHFSAHLAVPLDIIQSHARLHARVILSSPMVYAPLQFRLLLLFMEHCREIVQT